ncbi:POTRA domain-containing protein [Neptuniibacter sp. CAU 1671]|uniref:ShlB/FhaC/HecB family hemolysin secretion/activation protein n=1 Tax=Neptuniibacter sp. CAU 1671 TaxID=3032593 RepID=UPI0023DBA052|nr:POTRA domain-containing protein [Neptuniibacter sp. CAU 1671]MDF2181603.1 POTRA domain-containing protein [Neptuniibacter sp. CAU 1671]
MVTLPATAAEPPFIADPDGPTLPVPEYEPEQNKLPEAPQATSEVKDLPRFDVRQVTFQGGTVFTDTELQAMVAPIKGHKVSKAELTQALQTITKHYQSAGYPLSFAHLPRQSLANGNLIVMLIEGHIAQSDIKIEDPDVRARIEGLVAKLQQLKPLTLEGYERYISLIQSTPGYRFKVNVPRPVTTSGATTILVEATEVRTFDRSFNIQADQDEVRLQLGLTVNSLTSNADKLTVSGLIPGDTIESYLNIAYQRELGDDGLQLSLSANHFKSNGDDTFYITDIPVNNEEVKTRDRLKLGLNYPINLTRTSSWWLGGNLHYLDETSNYELTPEGFEPIYIEKNLRYSALELVSRWQDLNRERFWQLSGSIKQGLDLGNNRNEIEQSSSSRSGSEDLYFTYFKLDGLWRKSLTPQWRLTAKGSLFFSDDILPSAERVRYGGQRFGRGYDDGQAQGDRGIAAEIELRYLIPMTGNFVKRLEPYAAVDTAHTELNDPNIDSSISSYALGLEVTDTKHFSVGLEYAKPTGDPHVESGDHSPYYNLNLRWSF